jgi:prolyl-tRNA synthetase
LDDRSIYNPGWKYAHWEQKGVPIRIEVGPRDLENRQARLVIRFGGEKIDVGVDSLASDVEAKLEEIQNNMFTKAQEFRDDHLVQVTEWKDFVPNLELHNLVLTPWCGGEHTDWEEWVKEKSREESLANRGEGAEDARAATSVAAKTLCIPFKQPELPEGTKCIASGLPATCWVLWGRSY